MVVFESLPGIIKTLPRNDHEKKRGIEIVGEPKIVYENKEGGCVIFEVEKTDGSTTLMFSLKHKNASENEWLFPIVPSDFHMGFFELVLPNHYERINGHRFKKGDNEEFPADRLCRYCGRDTPWEGEEELE
jgi:hypothetical protein